MKKPISAAFYPFFGHFRSKGPSVLLLELAREVMMGPRSGNAQKTGENKVFFILRNQFSHKLKKVVVSEKKSSFPNHFFGFNNCTVRPTLGAVSCAIDNSIGTMKVF